MARGGFFGAAAALAVVLEGSIIIKKKLFAR